MDVRDRIALEHLDRMTDSTGLIQHAIYGVPRRESGYTTDDNARALRLCARMWCLQPEERMLSRVTGYLSFLEYARCPGGGFHNFLSYQRAWLDTEGTGDCQGQAVRALAEVLGGGFPEDYGMLARELIEAVLPTLADLQGLRAQAYLVLAWEQLWTAGLQDLETLERVAWFGARRLVQCYYRCAQPGWQWFESRMTYANAVLPHALFAAARRWPDEAFLEVAQASFGFLDRETTVEGFFCPVGNNGWYPQGQAKALYDQQPLEAATMADAALAAFGMLGDERYLATFRRAREWFHGQNSLRQPLADGGSGACCDALQPSGLNCNRGAESTLAYLWAELRNFEIEQASWDDRKAVIASA